MKETNLFNKEDYLKSYKGDKETAERVYNQNVKLSMQKYKTISFKREFRKVNYTIYCKIPKDFKIVVYLADYLLISELVKKEKLNAYALKEFFVLNGSLNFYFKEKIKLIKDIEVY